MSRAWVLGAWAQRTPVNSGIVKMGCERFMDHHHLSFPDRTGD
jgi:hypothetical protein